MTMDLKDIIKWFIPCFHIFLRNSKFKFFLVVYCLFLFFNSCPVQAQDYSVSDNVKLINRLNYAKYINNDRSDGFEERDSTQARSIESSRTFGPGRPLKKLAAALIPLAFQIGAASTWAIVAAVVGVKTLLVTLAILKLLLVAGAAKFGSLFTHKAVEPHHGWSPHQKEIHLHIHNSGQPGHEHYSDWNRDGAAATTEGLSSNTKPQLVDPYVNGPQTIHTPFGNYARIS